MSTSPSIQDGRCFKLGGGGVAVRQPLPGTVPGIESLEDDRGDQFGFEMVLPSCAGGVGLASVSCGFITASAGSTRRGNVTARSLLPDLLLRRDLRPLSTDTMGCNSSPAVFPTDPNHPSPANVSVDHDRAGFGRWPGFPIPLSPSGCAGGVSSSSCGLIIAASATEGRR